MTPPRLFLPEVPEWDVQVLRLAGQAMYGGADVFECLETTRAIREAGGSEVEWRRLWGELAERLAAGDPGDSEATRLQAAARASSYFRTAEFFAPFDSSDRKTLFDKARTAFRRAIPGFSVDVSVIAVPDGDVEYDGYVFHGRGTSADQPGPGVVLLGGADSYAEELYFFGGCALAERGITVVVADTPGRGSTIRHKGIVSRPDYEVPAARVLDFLCDLPAVDADRVGAVGLSLGGYYAPRLAAFDDRVKALVCWCGCLDVLEAIYEFSPAIRPQLTWIVGAADDAEARRRLSEFNVRGVAEQITCPTLVTHGEADTIMDVESARAFYEAVGAEDKAIRIWPADGFGGDHCNYDAWAECLPYMFDWLLTKLNAPA
jgi:alpha-beta hydrolase superfamily lysophospholipase